jgi:exodeoxyribonuclease-3
MLSRPRSAAHIGAMRKPLSVRLLSWNILSGGGSRCARILEILRRYDPDLITLQETLPTRAADLCHALGQAGYTHRFSAPRGARDRGLCVLSRLPARRVAGPVPPQAGVYPRGWLEVDLVAHGVRLAAVYGPAEGPSVPAFWEAAADWLACRSGRPFIMLGDFNAGLSGVDAEGYRFKAGDAFASLGGIGLVDLWRSEHGDAREHTWFSHPGGGHAGRGFRIDHAFASRAVAGRVTSCRYDHEVRERGLSDHSLLVVDLAME